MKKIGAETGRGETCFHAPFNPKSRFRRVSFCPLFERHPSRKANGDDARRVGHNAKRALLVSRLLRERQGSHRTERASDGPRLSIVEASGSRWRKRRSPRRWASRRTRRWWSTRSCCCPWWTTSAAWKRCVSRARTARSPRTAPRDIDGHRLRVTREPLSGRRPDPSDVASLLRRKQDDSEDKRVVGVLLGEHRKGRLDVTSSFAGTSPFRIEDAKPRACHEPALSFARHPARVSPFRQI